MRTRWTPQALADLQDVSSYIENRSSLAIANRVTRAIHSATRSLTRHPRRGRIGRIPGTRELVVPGLPYIVIYRVTEEFVELLNVIHTSREWPKTQ